MTNHQLQRNGVNVLPARASFVDGHTVRLDYLDGRGQRPGEPLRGRHRRAAGAGERVDCPFEGEGNRDSGKLGDDQQDHGADDA